MASPTPPSVSSTPLADHSAPPVQDFGLARWHGRDGIDAWTGTTLWTGERIDWDWAMVCLCPAYLPRHTTPTFNPVSPASRTVGTVTPNSVNRAVHCSLQ